jgi:hypothetical protein
MVSLTKATTIIVYLTFVTILILLCSPIHLSPTPITQTVPSNNSTTTTTTTTTTPTPTQKPELMNLYKFLPIYQRNEPLGNFFMTPLQFCPDFYLGAENNNFENFPPKNDPLHFLDPSVSSETNNVKYFPIFQTDVDTIQEPIGNGIINDIIQLEQFIDAIFGTTLFDFIPHSITKNDFFLDFFHFFQNVTKTIPTILLSTIQTVLPPLDHLRHRTCHYYAVAILKAYRLTSIQTSVFFKPTTQKIQMQNLDQNLDKNNKKMQNKNYEENSTKFKKDIDYPMMLPYVNPFYINMAIMSTQNMNISYCEAIFGNGESNSLEIEKKDEKIQKVQKIQKIQKLKTHCDEIKLNKNPPSSSTPGIFPPSILSNSSWALIQQWARLDPFTPSFWTGLMTPIVLQYTKSTFILFYYFFVTFITNLKLFLSTPFSYLVLIPLLFLKNLFSHEKCCDDSSHENNSTKNTAPKNFKILNNHSLPTLLILHFVQCSTFPFRLVQSLTLFLIKRSHHMLSTTYQLTRGHFSRKLGVLISQHHQREAEKILITETQINHDYEKGEKNVKTPKRVQIDPAFIPKSDQTEQKGANQNSPNIKTPTKINPQNKKTNNNTNNSNNNNINTTVQSELHDTELQVISSVFLVILFPAIVTMWIPVVLLYLASTIMTFGMNIIFTKLGAHE